MPYLLGLLAFFVWSGFVFYKGYDYKSTSVQVKVLQIEKARLLQRQKSLQESNNFKDTLNKTVEATNKQNQEKIDELQKKIDGAPSIHCDDKSIINGEFLRDLGKLR